MSADELYDAAEADVLRLLGFVGVPADGPVADWDPVFVFRFAYRLRLEPAYREAVRFLSGEAAIKKFRYPDVTAEPAGRVPAECFAAWLAAAEHLARAAMDAERRPRPRSLDVWALLGRCLDYSLRVAAPAVGAVRLSPGRWSGQASAAARGWSRPLRAATSTCERRC